MASKAEGSARPDHDARSSRNLLVGVVDFFVQALHGGCAWWKSVVHNHGNLKVARSNLRAIRHDYCR